MLGVLEVIFIVIFALEVVIKVVAMGLFYHPGSYLRSRSNVIDLVFDIEDAIVDHQG
ncbi:MAG: ion transporter [Planctomycetaceae bacterium]